MIATFLFATVMMVSGQTATRSFPAEPQARAKANIPDAEAHYALCRIDYNLEKWDQAIEECGEAVHFGNESEYHDWLGRAYGSKAEHAPWFQAVSLAKKAHAEFEKAVSVSGDDVQARRDLAEYYVEAPGFLGGGKEKAELQAVALDKLNKAAALNVRAQIAESNKDNAQAESLLKQAVGLSDRPAEALGELASFYRRTGNLDSMQATVAEIANRKEAGDALYEGASLLVRTGRALPQAVAMLRRFIAAGGTDAAPRYAAMYQLGLALKKQGDAEAAKQQFRNAVQLADYRPAKQALGNND